MKPKVVIDTNVIISSLISKGSPFEILHNYVLEDKIELLLSGEIYEEYNKVITRDKFKKYEDFFQTAKLLLLILFNIASSVDVSIRLDVSKDKDDNKFIELAVEGKADYIVTGNIVDYGMEEYNGIKIVTPKKFLELMEASYS